MIASQTPKPSPHAKPAYTVPGVCLLLVVAVWVVFGRTLWFDFVNFDDRDYFYANPQVLSGLTWHGFKWAFQIGYAANWHPLTWLSLMLDAQLFGTGSFGPHLTNVMLHAANAVLLFLLLRRLSDALWPSAFVAAVFAIHPLHVESVAWVSERKDVLSGLFFMLTLLLYARYGEQSKMPGPKSRVSLGCALLFFTGGLMSKPMLVTLPFVLLLLDYWPLKRLESAGIWRLIVEKLPFFLLSAVSCALTVLAQKAAIMPEAAFPLQLRLGNAAVAYVHYLGQLFYPVGLQAFYPYQVADLLGWKVVPALLLLAGITAGVFWQRHGRPWLLVGWCWYLGMLVPVIGLLQVGGQVRADRYTYLPLIGVCLGITWAVRDWTAGWRWRQPVLILTALSVLGMGMAGASLQAAYWRDSESLWRHALTVSPRNYVAQNNLASRWVELGRVAEAIGRYQTALELNPNYVEAHNNLGILLARQGRTREAIEHYQQALKFKADFVEAHINLGNALVANGQLPEAGEQYQQALELNPDSGEAHNGWGALLQRQGRSPEALEQFRTAAELMPNNPEVELNLGTVLAAEGQTTEAIQYYQQALGLKPDYAKAHFNLANLYAVQGRWDESLKHYQRAVELMPELTRAHYQFGLALQSRGRYAESVAEFQKALEQEPGNVATQNDLAWLLATCPDPRVRNGTRAVELARQAEQRSRGGAPEIADTLAAAYAEAGRFDEAVEAAGRALDLADTQHKPSLAGAIRTQLLLYKSRRPFRDADTNAGP